MLKKFKFWLTLFAIVVCLNNLVGNDDKNLILFLTSPHLMFLEDFSPVFRKTFPNENIYWGFYYVINIAGWFLIGWIIDFIVSQVKKQ
jgi:hypothetical protein